MDEIRYYPCSLSGCDFLSVKGSTVYHSEYLENGCIRLIECDKEEKSMKVKEKKKNDIEWNEINMDGFKQGVTIRLSDKGDRWEGNSLNNSPVGYGCIYNSENQSIYKGYIYEGMKVCFGIDFYGESGIIEYEGEYYKDMRYGYGRIINKLDQLVYEGEWLNNQPIELTKLTICKEMKENDISFGVKELIIEDEYEGNGYNFILHSYPHLQSIHIGRNCFSNVNIFEISNCAELEEVRIGEHCFCNPSMNSDSNFSIMNCNKLNSIELGKESINNFRGKFLLQSMISYLSC